MGIWKDRTNESATGTPAGDDGFGYAYRYRDPKSGMFEVTCDHLEAERVVGDDYEMVLVHFADGLIDRIVGSDSRGKERLAGAEDICGPRDKRDSFLDGWLEAESSSDVSNGDSPNARQRCECVDRSRYSRRAKHPDQPENGLGLAYRYVDHKTGRHELTDDADAWLIKDECETVWVLYRNGVIDRAATADEYQEELEVRIGERISEGLSGAKLNEFDLIHDQDEATRWLEENRPDYRDIVRECIADMERAIVLDEGTK